MSSRKTVIRLVMLGLGLSLGVLCAEIACRLFWLVGYGVPFFSPGRILYAFYPELKTIWEQAPERRDAGCNMLLLGGSTLHRDFGDVEEMLARKFSENGSRTVRIFNLGMPAHTSRDSLLKYAALEGRRFDLVVVYHGINESRANNIPPEWYRDDYGHFPYYETVNALSSYHMRARFSLPYSLRYLWLRARQRLRAGEYIPWDLPFLEPRKDWTRYGKAPRSPFSLKNNVEAIVDIATRRGDKVLLLTFATYIPENYSLDLFLEEKLDYKGHQLPVEIWGERAHVEAAIGLHNDAIRDIATRRRETLFLDMASRIPKEGLYFRDPCHFTREGSARFAEQLHDFVERASPRPCGLPAGVPPLPPPRAKDGG